MNRSLVLGLLAAVSLAGCNDAQVVSRNLSTAADNFHIKRRIVFYNGITGEYMLKIEGLCSIGHGEETKSVAITCRTGPDKYIKNFLGLSDNVTYFAEQLETANVSDYRYDVVFKPAVIIPSITVK